MAWWWKRQTQHTAQGEADVNTHGTSERDVPRKPQASPIPTPRTEAAQTDPPPAESAARWEIIKQDLIDMDPDFFQNVDMSVNDEKHATAVETLSDERLIESLKRLSIRYLVDESGALLAMWERHVLQIRREGPGGEILVLRARAYATLPRDWNERAFRAVNEWNRTRRFLKAYVGDPVESGKLPLHGEMQIPLRPGLSDALLDEFIDCAAAVSGSYIDWLYDEAGVL
ncbi:MAG TPA: YbjN domain-containing protein [Candidatus Stackebrandtia faecavium]|nr:YbjN domain-containing protein [Candidatus Stackebrandtia faecavium]